MITAAQLKAFAPLAPANTIVEPINAAIAAAVLSSPVRLAHFMAQTAVETGYFRRFEENLVYSAARIAEVWPHRFTEASAARFAHAPGPLANAVYANRMGNGGAASGDGWRFRGRGPLMTTGRDEYVEAARATGLDLIDHPDLLLVPAIGFKAAAAYWAEHDVNAACDAGDLAQVTHLVNGGLTDPGLRSQAYFHARKIWP